MNRKQAEREYKEAIRNAQIVEFSIKDQADYDVWQAELKKLSVARANLIAAEIAEPTPAEVKKANNTILLRNRGLDV